MSSKYNEKTKQKKNKWIKFKYKKGWFKRVGRIKNGWEHGSYH